jgi:hypothetical protein
VIISHKHKFIFVKTKKTAGTSIEIALSEFCGPDDIVTPLYPPDEMMRKSLGYRGSQHYYAPLFSYGPGDLVYRVWKGKKKIRYYNHITATEIRKYTGEKIWNDYFKFCFERNPWDRMVSFYYWYHKKEPRPTLREFIDSNAYTIDGKIAVDRICRYEKLDEEMGDLTVRLNLPKIPVLPRAKSDFRLDKRHYREILTDEEKKIIEKMFEKEIRLFGYEF